MKKIFLISIVSSLILICCASLKQKDTNTFYDIINLNLNELVEREKDTIYLIKKTNGNYFIDLIDDGVFIKHIKANDLYSIFTNENEISNFKAQLENPFLYDFSKIESPFVREYVKPIEKKNENGYYVQTRESLADFSKKKYYCSKPVFSINKKYGFILISKTNSHTSIKVYIRDKGNWKFYKFISIGIS